jgi:phenylacetate-CoA ligase
MTSITEVLILPISDLLLGYEVSKQLRKQRSYASYNEQELIDIQQKKLNAILTHAIQTVPAYKNHLDKKTNSPIERLQQFPVLTKIQLQGKEKSYLSNRFHLKKLIKLESSGSSGVKTTVYLTKKEHSVLRAILITWWEWTGFYLGKPILQTGMTTERGAVKWLKDILTNTHYLNAFELTENIVIKDLKRISKYESPHLGGYASSLYVLAEIAEKNNFNIQFDAAISWGDKMFDHYKSKIEQVFKTRVYENYACNEGLMIGQKVDLDYFYIYTPNVFLELLNEDNRPVPDGEIGRVVVTKLDGFAMPLIRYDTGDLAIRLPREEYPEQRMFQFPLLKKVIGRNTDIVKTLDGKNLIVHTFTGIFEFYHEIQQFRVVQREIDRIVIEYIPSPTFEESSLEKIQSDILTKTGSKIGIQWKAVNEIPSTGSGKPQLIKNYLIEQSLAEEK